MKKNNLALIGKGYWGEKLKRYIKESPYFNLVSLCNSQSDLEKEVWKNKKVDAVVIATPSDTHYSLTKKALLNGKDVLCEKPLSMYSGECEELSGISSEKNLEILVDYTHTFSKGLKIADKRIKEGVVGEILRVNLRLEQWGRFGRGNVYWLLGSHMLSILDMFIPLKDLEFKEKNVIKRKGVVETAQIECYNKKIHSNIYVSLNSPTKNFKVNLYGKKGTIIYDPLSEKSLTIRKYDKKGIEEYKTDESNNLRRMFLNFYRVLNRETSGNLDRAKRITKILENVERGFTSSYKQDLQEK